jgi:hypothetical protein
MRGPGGGDMLDLLMLGLTVVAVAVLFAVAAWLERV